MPERVHAQARSVPAQGAPAVSRVSGVIFDSLRTRRPLEGAIVLVSGSARMGVTDADGRFEIDSVPLGKRTLTFSTPGLDSLGLFTLGRDIDVTAGPPVALLLTTPSFATIWRSICPNARVTRGDSGIVYGSVSNAGNDQRLQGARVVFSWWDINKQQQQVTVDRPVLAVRSDSIGNYYACGLPLDVNVAIDVDAGTMGSGPIEAVLQASRIVRRDFLVSEEMHLADSSARAAGRVVIADGLGVRRRGTATLRGSVVDAKGAPVVDAMITVPSADTSVRTGTDGRFLASGLPSGSQPLRARKLGHGPLATSVDLKPGRETEVALVLPPATVLASVNVRADRTTNRALADFEQRKLTGFGYYVGAQELVTKPDVVSAFQGLPALRVQRRGGLATILVERGATVCMPMFYLDGKPSTMEEITFFRPEDLYGVELYTKGDAVPAQFKTSNNCGAVLVWTKSIR